jgi:hypothetical protein
VVARLGTQAVGLPAGVTYRSFKSVVVTDTTPGRVVFTGTVGGPTIKASDNLGLWSSSAATGTVSLVMRTGQAIKVGTGTLGVRSFSALAAPPKSMGQGRSTDATGFVTAKATLSDGRIGVLRIPLP